jgi:hypothetical protein
MSNAKLKEQIEAAKIALVHSAELETPLDYPQQPAQVTQITNSDSDSTFHDATGVIDTDKMETANSLQNLGQNAMPQSDFEILEVRLQDHQTQIKNQQRDLHTLLQKLRDITAKSKVQVEPKKSKGTTKLIFGFLLFGGSFSAILLTLGADVIMNATYKGIGQAVALIDALFNQL